MSIHEFYAEIDGKKIVAVVQEKETALNTYSDTVASGHGAYLFEKGSNSISLSLDLFLSLVQILLYHVFNSPVCAESNGIFKMNIGNLPPRKGTHLRSFFYFSFLHLLLFLSFFFFIFLSSLLFS